MNAASIEISIPEDINARVALEWAIQRLIRMVDYLEALEAFERENGTLPAECRLIVSAKNSEILHAAFGEDPPDVL